MTAPAPQFWLAVVLAGLVTYAVRATFFLLAGRMTELPPPVREVLRMIPAAALAALAIPPLLRPDGPTTALDAAVARARGRGAGRPGRLADAQPRRHHRGGDRRGAAAGGAARLRAAPVGFRGLPRP